MALGTSILEIHQMPMEDRVDKLKLIPILALVAAALSACGGGEADPAEVATLVAAQLQTDEAAALPTNTVAPLATAEAGGEAAPSLDLPQVVFTPGGLFADAERELIMARVVGPFIHYHADLEDSAQMLTVHVQPFEDDPSWLYKAEAIFAGGGYIGWLLPASDGDLDWWLPDCMGPCELSDSFRAAYPEIVAILEGE